MKHKLLCLIVAAVLFFPLSLFAAQKGTNQPLRFYAWMFMPDKISEYCQYFEQNYNEKVEVHILPNLGYVPAMQVKIMGGMRMDAFYNFNWNMNRWINVGWAAELTGKPGLDAIWADIIDIAKPLYTSPDGKIVSLPYFIAPFVTMYNPSLLKKAGYDHFPKNKEEMYEMCKALKKIGVKNPYIAYWIQDFVDEYFFIYLISEGIEPFDKNFDPIFQNNPETEKAFNWWVKMYKEGLTSPTILTDQISNFAVMMQEGEACFYNLHHYFLKGIVEAGGKESKNVVLGPWEPGKTGQCMLIGEVLQLSGRTPDPDRAWELLKFYSWKNKKGEYYVPKTWALAAGLLEPYKGFYQDKEIVDSFKSWTDWNLLMDIVQKKSRNVSVRQQVWYPEWRTEAGPLLHKMILGEIPVKDAIQKLAALAKDMKAMVTQ